MARQPKAGPNKGEPGRLFEYKGFWLTVESYGIYRINWYEPSTRNTRRRTKRKTTGTRILEVAKQKLIETAQATPPDDPQNPAVVDIAAVKRFYFQHHVKSIRDKDGPMRAFEHLSAYLAGVDVAGKVADLTLAHQEGFMR
jgi:hypothetical protein